MAESAAAQYVMGHDDRERRRLQLQASIINPITEQLFRRAGIGPGMHVLDVGSGVGDVALINARLVGPSGSVTACDLDADALAVLANRAATEGLHNITTIAGDVHDLALTATFDAVTGRHILIHLPNPKALLADVLRQLKSGGVVVFQEYDFSVVHPAYPPSALRESLNAFFRDFFVAVGRGSTGTTVPGLFRDLGLADIEARAEYPIDNGGADSLYYEWCVESARSILGRAQALGIPSAQHLDLDTMEARLRAEAIATGSAAPAAAMVGTVARKR